MRLAQDGFEGSVSEDDFEYTWNAFSGVSRFFRTATAHGPWVLFTAAAVGG